MKLKVILALLIGLGVVVSVKDYKKWRYEETKNYGHGPLESLAGPMELSQRYMNGYAGVRFRYPAGWTLEEKLVDRSVGAANPVVLNPVGIVEVARVHSPGDEVVIAVYVDRNDSDLVKVLEEEVAAGERRGLQFIGEREYVHTEREDWGILTWELDEVLIKRAWAVDGEDMGIVEARIKKSETVKLVRTVDEFIKGVTLI